MVSESIIDIDNLHGYISIPDKNAGKGLLLVHAWWGLNEFFKTLANRFASEGFVAFAPDYYDGKVATTVDDAKSLRMKLGKKQADVTLKNAVTCLRQHPSVTGEKIGVLGVSLGTRYSVNLARKMPKDIGAIVLFYGAAGGKFDGFRVPIQGHFAEKDEWGADPKAVKKFEARLGESDSVLELYIYQGTTHWFFEEDVTDSYHRPSAELAFRRAVDFLKSYL